MFKIGDRVKDISDCGTDDFGEPRLGTIVSFNEDGHLGVHYEDEPETRKPLSFWPPEEYELVQDSRDLEIARLRAELEKFKPKMLFTHFSVVWFDPNKPEDVIYGGFINHRLTRETLLESEPKAQLLGWVHRYKYTDGTYKTKMELANA